jgi:hypothetical protein
MQSLAKLIVIYGECRKQAHYAERHYAECRGAVIAILNGKKNKNCHCN